MDFGLSFATLDYGALAPLSLLEIVLGIDNLVIVTLIASRVEPRLQQRALVLGLIVSTVLRLGFLPLIAAVEALHHVNLVTLTEGYTMTAHDLVLGVGALVLMMLVSKEMIHAAHPEDDVAGPVGGHLQLGPALTQMAGISALFSLDGVLTAIGMTQDVTTMALAIIVSTVVSLAALKPIARFVKAHIEIKLLALSFVAMIALTLLAEAVHAPIPKATLYALMAFGAAHTTLLVVIRQRRQGAKS